MVQYRFRLTGVPPDQAIKMVEVDPNFAVAEIKKIVQHDYKLNPILAIQFIYKGKVLPDNIKFAKIGIHPKKDLITVMALQAGGARDSSRPFFPFFIESPNLLLPNYVPDNLKEGSN